MKFKTALFSLFCLLNSQTSKAAPTLTTPAMNLVLPVPGVQIGPAWAQNINQAFQVLDTHNHVPGSGIQVPSAGININADLGFKNFNAFMVRSVILQNNIALLSGPNDFTNIYVSNGNLYFNNASGIAVQLTSGNGLATGGASGGISGMGGTTASVTYNLATKTFNFAQTSGITAGIYSGPLTLFTNTAGSNGVTLNAKASTAAYSITLPGALPTATKIMTLDNTGNITAVTDVDNSTIVNSSGILKVPAQGIGQSNLAARPIGQLVGNVAQSASVDTFSTTSASPTALPGVSVTLSTTGRPVQLMIVGSNTVTNPNASNFGLLNPSATVQISSGMIISIKNASNANTNCTFSFRATVPTLTSQGWGAGQSCLDYPASGTQTYTVYTTVLNGPYLPGASVPSGYVTISGVYLVAYEI